MHTSLDYWQLSGCFPFIVLLITSNIKHSILSLQILIEGVIGKNYKGDIAIDDVWIDDDPCPHEGKIDVINVSCFIQGPHNFTMYQGTCVCVRMCV